eukprot:gene24850-biopygen14978
MAVTKVGRDSRWKAGQPDLIIHRIRAAGPRACR